MTKLAEVIERLAEHNARLCRMELSGVLMHCSNGVERSPVLLAAYVGRQIWEKNDKVNVLGILRYIHRHRYEAFGRGHVGMQIQVVFDVMRILATRIEFFTKSKLF